MYHTCQVFHINLFAVQQTVYVLHRILDFFLLSNEVHKNEIVLLCMYTKTFRIRYFCDIRTLYFSIIIFMIIWSYTWWNTGGASGVYHINYFDSADRHCLDYGDSCISSDGTKGQNQSQYMGYHRCSVDNIDDHDDVYFQSKLNMSSHACWL